MAINTRWTDNTVNLPSYAPDPGLSPSSIDTYKRYMQEMERYKYAPERQHYPITFTDKARSMIAMRLRIQEGACLPYQCFAAHEAPNKVIVFVVKDDQPLVLEDDKDLFPSDKLITSLRLLDR